jgi:hypothetical protein
MKSRAVAILYRIWPRQGALCPLCFPQAFLKRLWANPRLAGAIVVAALKGGGDDDGQTEQNLRGFLTLVSVKSEANFVE